MELDLKLPGLGSMLLVKQSLQRIRDSVRCMIASANRRMVLRILLVVLGDGGIRLGHFGVIESPVLLLRFLVRI